MGANQSALTPRSARSSSRAVTPLNPGGSKLPRDDTVDDRVADPARTLMDRIGQARPSVRDDEMGDGSVSATSFILDHQRGVILAVGGGDGAIPYSGQRGC
jgi:hypothetical protein